MDCRFCGVELVPGDNQALSNAKARNHACDTCHRVNSKAIYNNLKDEIISHYSNGTGVCAICGTDKYLELDHINGGGNKHRKELKITSGYGFFRWIRKNNFPPEFRILCVGCNALSRYMTTEELTEHYKNLPLVRMHEHGTRA